LRALPALFVLPLFLVKAALAGSNPTAAEGVNSIDKDFPPAAVELNIEIEGQRMPGLLYQANGAGPHPTLLLLHGLPGNEKNLDIAQAARSAGFNALFLNYRGAWGAEGNYALLQLPTDALAAIDFLSDPQRARQYRIDTTRISTLGHSMGGYASLAAGSASDQVICAGALAPANLSAYAEGIRNNQPRALGVLDYADTLYMLRGFNGEVMRKELLSRPIEELDNRGLAAGLRGKSVLMVAATGDTVTPPALMFDPVVRAYRQDTKIRLREVRLAGDHSFSWDRIALTDLILEWLNADCR
jgi:pimeloyl-ACP methyl ester carboxylesterase